MAIINNQGALIGTNTQMISYGDGACDYYANSSAVGGTANQLQYVSSMMVLRYDIAQRFSSTIVIAAVNSGLCAV